MAAIEAIGELCYHEQQEDWKRKQVQDGKCVCIQRPRELGGGLARIDYEVRTYSFGYGKPRRHARTGTYTGNGWQDRILRDAIDHLETVMTVVH